MDSVFETAPATPAIPITFATKATWDAICAELPAQARQFAQANGFKSTPPARHSPRTFWRFDPCYFLGTAGADVGVGAGAGIETPGEADGGADGIAALRRLGYFCNNSSA